MSEYVYAGPADIDRAIAMLISLDEAQHSALAVLQIDDAIARLGHELQLSQADPGYRPDNDFIAQLSSYIAYADEHGFPQHPA
ncbi:hypothetical protein [Compostimonas suwonensis]|uniref:Uncharacterized protein n=1 Tax=Compostimonas suwonensis TaxID=1048394 RepID=A0A2M9BTW5_9MICO|nr:hypothetical protein [Compostimonas suwonensis]PJJ61387.1 hypothetical protein CLV54_2332 [Compostimonas suwonensis]